MNQRYLRISGGPATSSIRVLDCDGNEVPGIRSISLRKLTPDSLVVASIELIAELDELEVLVNDET